LDAMPFSCEPFTVDSFDSSKCIICQSHIDELLSVVTDRGRPTLLNFCRTREWSILADILSAQTGQTVLVHSSCRKRFTRLTTVDTYDTDSSEYSHTKQLRSKHESFNWKQSCFLCKEDVDFQYDETRARHVGTLELRTAILQHCEQIDGP